MNGINNASGNTFSDSLALLLFGGSAILLLRHRRRLQTIRQDDRSEDETMSTSRKSLRLVRYLSGEHKGPWEAYDDDDEIFIQTLPKVELHVHLDGSFDPDFLFNYMKTNPKSIYQLPVESDLPWEPGTKLPIRSMVKKCKSSQQYHKLCTCRGYRSLKAMLNCFEIFLPLVRGNLDLIEQLSFDFCQRQWEQHVIYTEVRYSPFLLAEGYQIEEKSKDAVSGEMVLDAVTRGLRRGVKQFDIVVNQILCAITWRPDWAEPTLDLVLKHLNDYPCATVGIDVAAGEEHFDPNSFPELYQPHFNMIQRAKEMKVPITLHAGEATEFARENVRRAIIEYGASRIGHGYRMVDSMELMHFVRNSECHVEVCPTSSNETGGWVYNEKRWSEHPCVTMLNNGLRFSLSSDDPAVFHTSLAWQYRIALAKMGISRDELIRISYNAVDAAFCPAIQKEELRERIRVDTHRSTRHSFRRSVSESFVDRVYLDNQRKHKY